MSHSLGESITLIPLLFSILGHYKISDMSVDHIQSSYNSAQQERYHFQRSITSLRSSLPRLLGIASQCPCNLHDFSSPLGNLWWLIYINII